MNRDNLNQNEEKLPKEKKHNYFYKITNLINGKFYYGVHSTNKEKYDYYMGGGKLITAAIKKYGKINFKKEIIADYPTRKEASDHEKLIVTMDLVLDENCYNLRTGGDAEYLLTDEHRTNIGLSSKGRLWSNKTKQQKSDWAKQQELSDEFKDNMFKSGCFGNKNKFFGKTHTPEFRKKLSEIHSGGNNYNAIRLIHIETNKIFDTKTQAIRAFNLTDHMLNKQIKLGLFKIIPKNV